MHSYDELKKQYDAAKSRTEAAKKSEREALLRLCEVSADCHGFPVGSVVTVMRGSTTLKERWRITGAKPTGYNFALTRPDAVIIKKDGTEGTKRIGNVDWPSLALVEPTP